MARALEAGCNDCGVAAALMEADMSADLAADLVAERWISGQNRYEAANSRPISRAQPLASRGSGR